MSTLATIEKNIKADSVVADTATIRDDVLGSETLTASGAASPTIPLTVLNSSGVVAATVANGVNGTTKTFVGIGGGAHTVTFANTHGAAVTATMGAGGALGDTVTAVFVADKWAITSTQSSATATPGVGINLS